MKGDHLGSEKVLTIFDTLRNVDDLVSLVVDDRVGPPSRALQAFLLNLEPERSVNKFLTFVARAPTSYQPSPTPVSVFASVTFFKYAITGPYSCKYQQLADGCEGRTNLVTGVHYIVRPS
jgi:hypothetical protein